MVTAGSVRARAAILLFSIWLAAAGALLGWMTVSHAVPLSDGALAKSRFAPTGSWRVIHILSPDCGCSRRVARYLSQRHLLRGARESVWMTGGEMPGSAALAEAGFEVQVLNTPDLRREYGIKGVPWLIFVAPDGEVAYSGGYLNPLRGNPDGYQDQDIWTRVRAHGTVHSLPVFGCSLSRRIEKSSGEQRQ